MYSFVSKLRGKNNSSVIKQLNFSITILKEGHICSSLGVARGGPGGGCPTSVLPQYNNRWFVSVCLLGPISEHFSLKNNHLGPQRENSGCASVYSTRLEVRLRELHVCVTI